MTNNENRFKPLAGDMYELFEACRDAGFDSMQAFELTKTYCSVAFVNQALDTKAKEERRRESYETIKKRMAQFKRDDWE